MVSSAWADSWTSGACTVTLDGTTLRVSGSGAMADYEFNEDDPNPTPWYDKGTSITSVVIESGVTHIGNYSFFSFSNIESLSIPASVESIGNGAFSGCILMESFTAVQGSQLKSIGKYAFYGCMGLTDVTLYSNPFIDDNAFSDEEDPVSYYPNITMNLTGREGQTGEYWTTFYNEHYTFVPVDENTQVFTATLTGTTLALTEVLPTTLDLPEDVSYGPYKIVPWDNPVILKSSSPNIVMEFKGEIDEMLETMEFLGESYVMPENELQGTSTTISNPGENNYYVLNNGTKDVGFYKLKSTGTIGFGKAYLTYSAPGAAPEFFAFDEDVTGISEIEKMRNGENESFYDLQGRRVAQPTKGLYIVNGKKVVIK